MSETQTQNKDRGKRYKFGAQRKTRENMQRYTTRGTEIKHKIYFEERYKINHFSTLSLFCHPPYQEHYTRFTLTWPRFSYSCSLFHVA